MSSAFLVVRLVAGKVASLEWRQSLDKVVSVGVGDGHR